MRYMIDPVQTGLEEDFEGITSAWLRLNEILEVEREFAMKI